ncbi:hypothetical protein OHU11_41705 (plasmid) [Streptomyces sp. NBC_00257]|uniref:hypothetical protein n=1 Tax=unclassified Streptomyces TaxID=2593676 RepID=UPI00225A99B7|nr:MULTISPECIES: hypothetical protein [unclassified Streptomyces]MCX5434697.1 hypothetical protein [Streptomyces sp. NBC_00062]
MDLQGIGALGAVLVAAVGIPATILVGRWQTRAALRSAEATSQAGIAQAEATYRAALDQAAAQTTAAHEQWRRGIRRDAWAAFLLAVEDAVSSGHSALNGTDEDLPALRRAMKTTLVVLELEGPPPVVEAAKLLRLKCNDYLELVNGDLLASRAWHALESAAQEERENLSGDAATPVHDAEVALSTLASLMHGVRGAAGGQDFVLWGLDPNEEPEAVYERTEQTHTAAASALAACPAVSAAQARTLLHDAAHGGRFEMGQQAHDSLEFLDQARAAFLEAARAQLDTTQ